MHIVYSLIVPVYNEQDVLPLLFERLDALVASLGQAVEVIFVNDGSSDGSLRALVAAHERNNSYRIVSLSRNFGHQVAISAGMAYAAGKAAIIMDADLQDPPETVLRMIERWKQGYDVVHAVRAARPDDSWFKRWTAGQFYRLLEAVSDTAIQRDAGDFRLVSRRAIDAFLSMPERDRFVRGMFSWIGFNQCTVEFVRGARAAGASKYPVRRMLRFATSGILGFSDAPLRLIVGIGFLVSVLSAAAALLTVILWFAGARMVPGWASLVFVQTFLMGLNFLLLGVVGLYVGRTYDEVKRRPLYLVEATYGFAGLPPSE
jgi:dolichol-phosphate mannosyltransferase